MTLKSLVPRYSLPLYYTVFCMHTDVIKHIQVSIRNWSKLDKCLSSWVLLNLKQNIKLSESYKKKKSPNWNMK